MWWSVWWSSHGRRTSWLILHSSNGGIAYPYLSHYHWTTTSLMRIIVQALGSNILGNSSACHVCSLWSCGGLWGDLPLSDILNDWYTLVDWWDSISMTISSSLDHYTTDKVHGSNSLFQKLEWHLNMSGVEFVIMVWSSRWSNPLKRISLLI